MTASLPHPVGTIKALNHNQNMNTLSTEGLCVVAAVQLIIGAVSLLVWRRYFSPLSDLPGPFFASLSRLWYVKHILTGDHDIQLVDLHEKHGE